MIGHSSPGGRPLLPRLRSDWSVWEQATRRGRRNGCGQRDRTGGRKDHLPPSCLDPISPRGKEGFSPLTVETPSPLRLHRLGRKIEISSPFLPPPSLPPFTLCLPFYITNSSLYSLSLSLAHTHTVHKALLYLPYHFLQDLSAVVTTEVEGQSLCCQLR